MNDRTEERIDELIALAALGELSGAEELELDGLLTDDPELTDELDGAVHTAALLQQTLAENPPEQLRASVLGAISKAAQIGGDRPVAAPSIDEPSVIAPVIDLSARRRSRWVSALSAAAAMIMLAGIGVVVVGGDTGPDGDRLAMRVENVVSSDDAVSRELRGVLDGSVTVVYSRGEEAFVIDGDGLPVLGEDRAFVLWFVDDGAATPVQTFRPDASGDVLVRVDGVDPTDFMLGITEENAGGAETPTLPMLASA